MYKAWEITTGLKAVKVGIIDSGIHNHIDLSNNIASSWNFVYDDNSFYDKSGHGTNVAGIIAASHMSKKIYGVCDNISLIDLNVYDNYGCFDKSAFIKAVYFAINNDIPILNYCNSTDIYDHEIEEVIREYRGLFICSAGNDGRNIDKFPKYPSSNMIDNVISVAALGYKDNLLGCSNYGRKSVHLGAPGANILTTSNKSDCLFEYCSGTSAATPFVTGVAALIKSITPNADANFIKKIILSSVDRKIGLYGKVSSCGKLNAYKALLNARKFTI